MSDQGEKTCPLCAEEMDLTDQQLRPCKCGYQICVWCWHHIMDMAEKDDTEGRCPACRSPYNKEKIVGMATNCGRMVAEISMERKMRSQKAKTKPSEGRKQLTSVRVMQRNLVYVVGLPLSLADEDLLQRKEYFGQYGRVLKVSMSRGATGAIQQFPNNTCSVYITYSKEDEAVRCIQTVHGFILDGRSLRACFGTTKYCHAWLRNVPCGNPDCLYLHEIGSQEDSFTKDEIVSDYPRNRVHQITGAAHTLQRRSGDSLPPPIDDYYNNSSYIGKPVAKNVSNNLVSIVKGPPNSSSGRSVALPAAASWGTRAPNFHPPAMSLACSNGPLKVKLDTLRGSSPSSSAAASATASSKLHEAGKKLLTNEESQTLHTKVKSETDLVKVYLSTALQTTASETIIASAGSSARPLASIDNGRSICSQPEIGGSEDRKCGDGAHEEIRNMCSIMSSMSIDKKPGEHSAKLNSLPPDHNLMKSPGSETQELKHYSAEQSRELLSSTTDRKAAISVNALGVSKEQYDLRLDSKSQVADSEVQDLLSFADQRLNDSNGINNTAFPSSSHLLNLSSDPYDFNADHATKSSSRGVYASDCSVISNGYPENPACLNEAAGHPHLLPSEGKMVQIGRFDEGANFQSGATTDIRENSIISNILSLDFDAWDDSLRSPQNLAKLLGETDKQHDPLKIPNSWKVQNNNQSRFSFARQEESTNFLFDAQPTFNNIREVPKNLSYSQNLGEYGDTHLKQLGNGKAFHSSNVEESDNLMSSHPFLPSSNFSVSRAQVSAPPGFSVPNRVPPPGFLSHERMDQAFDTAAGNRILETSSLLRNPYRVSENVNMGSNEDIESMDPAILAVGKGRLPGGLDDPGLDLRPNIPQQFSVFENEARLHLLMQQSLSPHQNLRFPDIRDNFSPLTDSYGIPSRLVEQSQTSNLAPFSNVSLQQSRNALMYNGHWDGWNGAHNGNNLGMAELLRNERLGFNKIYGGFEDSKFRMPNLGDLFNRTYGM